MMQSSEASSMPDLRTREASRSEAVAPSSSPEMETTPRKICSSISRSSDCGPCETVPAIATTAAKTFASATPAERARARAEGQEGRHDDQIGRRVAEPPRAPERAECGPRLEAAGAQAGYANRGADDRARDRAEDDNAQYASQPALRQRRL